MPGTERPITLADLDPADEAATAQAAELLVAAFPSWDRDEAREQVALSLGAERICLAARAGEEVLGWVGAMPSYSHAWELHPLVVRENARRRGIGRALVAALEERLRGRDVLTLYLGTDDEGEMPGTSAWGVDLFPDPLVHAADLAVIDHPAGFYRRLGFTAIGLIPDANGPGKPDILMAKRISACGR